MHGWLILPQQEWFDKLPTEIISSKEWGIDSSAISIKKGEDKSVQNVARHLRNSGAHYNFTAFSNKNEKIGKIEFKDHDFNKSLTFSAEIPISHLKSFLKKFGTEVILRMDKNK